MQIEKATLGNGCFWCTEAIFKQINGVIKVTSGYSGGHMNNPDYKSVCTGQTGHAECLEIEYNAEIVKFEDLLEVFWKTHDPTTLNQQGNDIGTQYRSAIFTTTAEQMKVAQTSRDIYQSQLNAQQIGEIVTEIVPSDGKTYWLAEEYHQKYLAKNPNGYDCHSSSGVVYPLTANVK